jgi:hypothetical protein
MHANDSANIRLCFDIEAQLIKNLGILLLFNKIKSTEKTEIVISIYIDI